MHKKIRPFFRRGCPFSPSPLPSDDARKKIMMIATRQFAERGLEGVSVRDICHEAKTNVSLVSYYFGGKEGLYKTILTEHALEIKARWTEASVDFLEKVPSQQSFTEQVRFVVTTIVEMRLAQPEISMIMQRERLSNLPFSREIFEEIMGPLCDQMVSLIEEAQKKNVVRKDLNARAYFVSLTESVLGYFISHDVDLKFWKGAYRFPKQKNEFIDFMVSLFTQGALQ